MNTNSNSLISAEAEGEVRSGGEGRESGVMARAGLVVALSLTLVGAMRWALNVTNANARQISTNLTHLQDGYERQAMPPRPVSNKLAPKRPLIGPAIEPE